MRALEAIRQAGARVQEIVLASLGLADIGRLVRCSALRAGARTAPGATGAREDRRNPFFCHPVLTRASQSDGKSDIYTTAGHRTNIVLTVPIPS
jgi:hypothetical protein